MHRQVRNTDAVLLYMAELHSRVVARSQQPSDRHHFGKIILQSLKDEPEFIQQIDAATGEEESNGSVLERSVRCARALQGAGLRYGDVVVLMAPNHRHLCVPLYAALYLGLVIAPIDRTLTVKELQEIFEVDNPKIVFCQSERVDDVQAAISPLKQNAQVVAFDGSHGNAPSLNEFLEKGGEADIDNFEADDFDTKEAIAFIVATSGTTGVPKQTIVTHENFSIAGPYTWRFLRDFPHPFRSSLLVSPLQWMTSLYNYIYSVIFKFTRIQSSLDMTQEHAYYCINKYKPANMILSPPMLRSLVGKGDRDKCDFSSYEYIVIGGSAVSKDLIDAVKEVNSKAMVANGYGMSEMGGIVFAINPELPYACGTPSGHLEYRLIDLDTEKDIVEPNKPGELWMKGICVSRGYYNNPEATEKAFAEDNWFKSGDMFYRDEKWNFHFVERIKFLLKYRNHQVSPAELESVIRRHPGVLEVAVTGIPDAECGDLPVACVVKRPGSQVTAQDIKDLVKENLTDSKQLRGGVIFMDKLPLTASSKLHIKRLNEMVKSLARE